MGLDRTMEVDWKALPRISDLTGEVHKRAKDIRITETLFMKQQHVRSEAEYKRACMKQHKIMTHAHIGWNSFERTKEGFRYIYDTLQKADYQIDRFGVCIDWTMGVPEAYRHQFPKGTGLIFENPDDWKELGQVIPVQLHMGDHMIGSMNSFENTGLAIGAGATTIGNIGQYFTFSYPVAISEEERVVDTVKALMLMAEFKELGTIVHSNLDDGFGAQFQDLADLTGWSILERYIVEELLGAGMCHCFGNLFSDPVGRIEFVYALDNVNKTGTPGSMINGNTIDYGLDFDKNYGAISAFLLGDTLGQLHRPTGHSVYPVPVTEAMRIPTADDILHAHQMMPVVLERAGELEPYMNWDKIEGRAEVLARTGHVFFERVLNGLSDIGVDIRNPIALLYTLKKIGPSRIEEEFGLGRRNPCGEREPIRSTDIRKTIQKRTEDVAGKIGEIDHRLDGIRVIVGTTDVHEFGKEMIKGILKKAGATVFDLGTYVTAEEILETVLETESPVIAISCYNGIAYSFSKEITECMEENGLHTKLLIGGIINENMDGTGIPEDVTDRVRALGVNCDNDAEKVVDNVLLLAKEAGWRGKEG